MKVVRLGSAYKHCHKYKTYDQLMAMMPSAGQVAYPPEDRPGHLNLLLGLVTVPASILGDRTITGQVK